MNEKIERITGKILEDARAKARKIKEEYQDKAKELKEEYDQRINEQKEKERKRLESEARALKSRIVSEEEVKIRLEYLKRRYELIDEIIIKTVAKIPKTKNYFNFLTEIIENSNWKEGEILLSAEDRKRFGKKLIDWGKKNGYAFELGDQNPEIIGGLLLKRGKELMNGTLDTIIDELKEEILVRVREEIGIE